MSGISAQTVAPHFIGKDARGGVPLWLGVIAHEGSSVAVCLNALRLLLGKNK